MKILTCFREQLQADLGEKSIKQLKKKSKLEEEIELIRAAMEYEDAEDELGDEEAEEGDEAEE